jgi:hypothetical protein
MNKKKWDAPWAHPSLYLVIAVVFALYAISFHPNPVWLPWAAVLASVGAAVKCWSARKSK